jgi:hypothetical protein
MQIPTAGYRFRLAGRTELIGHSAIIVEARPTESATREFSWARSLYYLTEDPPLLLGADHYASAGEGVKPEKRMRVEGVREVDGAWTETRIVMTAPDGRSSVLTLDEFKAAVPNVGAELLDPQGLAEVAHKLPAGLVEVPPRKTGGAP